MKILEKSLVIGTLLILIVALSACGGGSDFEDGTYFGKSLEDDAGGIGEVTIVIKEGEIVDCTYVTYDESGNIKDERYGKDSGNDAFYEKAQIAVEAMKDYPKQLKEKKQPELVEAISGATISYDQFNEAVDEALKMAVK